MSIFEPIPRESRMDDGTQELDPLLDDDPASVGGSFDPRPIMIAGAVVVAIVVAGVVATNLARPEPSHRPLVASRVEPGAAAVEQTEAKRPVPTTAPSAASPSAEPVEETDSDSGEDDGPAWSTSDDSSDYSSSGGSKWDDKPGRGHGRGRD